MDPQTFQDLMCLLLLESGVTQNTHANVYDAHMVFLGQNIMRICVHRSSSLPHVQPKRSPFFPRSSQSAQTGS